MVSVQVWKDMQAISGLSFGVFLCMHLFSHYSLRLSFETANSHLLRFRTIYQHPVFEISLLLSLLLHMTSNVQLYLLRRKVAQGAKEKTNGKDAQGTTEGAAELSAHRYAGYFLGLSLFGHVGATRLAPYMFLDDPSEYDYGFIKAVNDKVPYNLFAGYLCILGMAGGWHLIYGSLSAVSHLLGSPLLGKPFPTSVKYFAMASHVFMINGIVALCGYHYAIDNDAKADLHKKLIKAMGV
jgi:hypothetical protein